MSNLGELSKDLSADEPVEATKGADNAVSPTSAGPSNAVSDADPKKDAATAKSTAANSAKDVNKPEKASGSERQEGDVSASDSVTKPDNGTGPSSAEVSAAGKSSASPKGKSEASDADDPSVSTKSKSKKTAKEDDKSEGAAEGPKDKAENTTKIPKPTGVKEKKKGGSLVERAASMSGSNPFNRPIGKIGEPRRDPSAMNPIAPPPPAASFRGIGGAGGPKKPKSDDSSATGADGPAAFTGVAAPEKKQSALERMANAVPEKPLVQKKERKVRPPQEIDLVALREAGYITPDMPPNLMSEEFRIIKRSLLLHAFTKGKARSKKSNVMLVTSSNPSEGKTFCTINLALSIATEQDITVLLIDADFSKPEILNRLGVNGGRGLMDVVADENIDIGDCLIRTNVPNLVLLPAGRQHNLTTELLASERMETMVEEIATRYPDRLVIFDSPPVLASSAASVLALYMGQTVFVIEAEKTTEPQIKESLSMISSCENINLLLNKTRYNSSNQKFASYYGYGGR